MNSVYKYLSHHYVLKRSIVFIVDTDFSSVVYKKKVAQYVKDFFNEMSPTDCFGYISLGKSSNNDEILLEPKERNTHIKTLFLKSMKHKESELLFLGDRAMQTRKDRFEKALQKALDWQVNRVEDKLVTINDHIYHDPYKWIVCLIGSDIYPVNPFLIEHMAKLKQTANLSVSIMALSSEPHMSMHVKDYRKLCFSTSEGIYLNVVDNGQKADRVAARFFSTMEVYPSTKVPILREFFQAL